VSTPDCRFGRSAAKVVATFPLPGIASQAHAVICLVAAHAGLVAPPECGPVTVRTCPDNGELVNDPVAIVVIVREVKACGIRCITGFEDELLAFASTAVVIGVVIPAGVLRHVPAEGVAVNIQRSVAGLAVVVAMAAI